MKPSPQKVEDREDYQHTGYRTAQQAGYERIAEENHVEAVVGALEFFDP
jgi:hypothetical protein